MAVAVKQRKKSGPISRTPTEREEHLELVAKMDRRGHTQHEIAIATNRSQPAISQDLAIIRQRYRESMLKSQGDLVQEKLQQYKEVRRIAWLAYDRSMEDAEKEVEEFGTIREEDGSGDYSTSEARIKRITTREGRLPANAYLTTIMQTLEAERKLLGLDEAVKVDLSGTIGVFSWDTLLSAMSAPQTNDAEKRLAEVEGIEIEAKVVSEVTG